MASIINPLDKDKEEQDAQAGNPQQISSGEAAVTGQAGGSASDPQGTKSGRFTNISNYLKANSGYNAQGGGLAGKVAGNIQNQGQQVNQQVGQAKDEFNNAAQANRIQNDPNKVNDTLNNATSAVNNQQNVDDFQKMLNAKYNGPEGVQNAGVLQNNAQNVQNLTKQTGTEGGRFNLLRDMFNKPTYTGGQQKLDNLLLQGNQDQLRQLTGTRQVGNQVVNNANSTVMGAVDEAQKFKDEAANTAKSTNEAYNSFVGNKQAELEKQMADKLAQRQAAQDNIGKALTDRELSPEDLQKYGLQEGQETYGLDLNSYLNKDNAEANLQNTASKDQAMNMNALAKLAGKEGQFDPNAAGTFGANPYTFDNERLKGDLGARKATYDRITADANNAQNAAWGAMGGSQGQVDQVRKLKLLMDKGLSFDQAKLYTYGLGDGDEAQRDLQNLSAFDQAMAQKDQINQSYGIGNTINKKAYEQKVAAQKQKEYDDMIAELSKPGVFKF